MVGLPRSEKFRDPEAIRRALLLTVGELQIPEIMAAVKETNSNEEIGKELRESGKAIFSYDCRGKTWWAGLTSYPLGKTSHLWISILVPNNDLLEGVSSFRLYVLAGSLVALLAALAYSFLLARSYSKPLEALATQSRAMREFNFRADGKIETKLREVRELAQAQAQSLAALQSFANYVPIEVVKELVSKGEVARIGGRIETLTVLFTDIAGFTKISESMSPEVLTNHMAEYFQAMIDTLNKHPATVDKIVGDAIMAFWGAPTPVAEPADKAIQAVLECQAQLKALNEQWQARGLPPLPTRFGLATGPVVVGNIGARTRLAYTVLGDPVNLASRLEGLNKIYGSTILVDEATRQACSDHYEWRHLDRIIAEGKTEPTEIFEVLGRAGTVAEKALAGARRYEAAWDQYRSGDFQQALKALQDFESEYGLDLAVQLLRERCEAYRKSPPGDGWDGTSKMTTKLSTRWIEPSETSKKCGGRPATGKPTAEPWDSCSFCFAACCCSSAPPRPRTPSNPRASNSASSPAAIICWGPRSASRGATPTKTRPTGCGWMPFISRSPKRLMPNITAFSRPPATRRPSIGRTRTSMAPTSRWWG